MNQLIIFQVLFNEPLSFSSRILELLYLATEVGLKPTYPLRRLIQSQLCLSFHHSAIVLAGDNGLEPLPLPTGELSKLVRTPSTYLPNIGGWGGSRTHTALISPNCFQDSDHLQLVCPSNIFEKHSLECSLKICRYINGLSIDIISRTPLPVSSTFRGRPHLALFIVVLRRSVSSTTLQLFYICQCLLFQIPSFFVKANKKGLGFSSQASR